jgi:hypothetical protein
MIIAAAESRILRTPLCSESARVNTPLEHLLMMINAVGRQMASSAGTLVSTESIANAYDSSQKQLQGFFGVMPCLLPNSSGLARVQYGVPHEMGMEMAKRAVDEVRARNALLPPHIQLAEVQKLIEERKKASTMVRLVTLRTNLTAIDLSVGWFSGTTSCKRKFGDWFDYQESIETENGDMVHNLFST